MSDDEQSATSGRRKREGNEADVLVLKARSAAEALQAREVLAGVGVALDMPEAAVEVIFAGGAESMEIRVPLEHADAASAAIEQAFGADRLPSREDAPAGGGAAPSLSEIEARAKAIEAEEAAERAAAEAEDDEDEDDDDDGGESPLETLIYGVVALVFLIGFVYMVSTM